MIDYIFRNCHYIICFQSSIFIVVCVLFLVDCYISQSIWSCFTYRFEMKLKTHYAVLHLFSVVILLILVLLAAAASSVLMFSVYAIWIPVLHTNNNYTSLTLRVLLYQIGRVLIGLPHHRIQTTRTPSKLRFKPALTWSVAVFWDKSWKESIK